MKTIPIIISTLLISNALLIAKDDSPLNQPAYGFLNDSIEFFKYTPIENYCTTVTLKPRMITYPPAGKTYDDIVDIETLVYVTVRYKDIPDRHDKPTQLGGTLEGIVGFLFTQGKPDTRELKFCSRTTGNVNDSESWKKYRLYPLVITGYDGKGKPFVVNRTSMQDIIEVRTPKEGSCDNTLKSIPYAPLNMDFNSTVIKTKSLQGQDLIDALWDAGKITPSKKGIEWFNLQVGNVFKTMSSEQRIQFSTIVRECYDKKMTVQQAAQDQRIIAIIGTKVHLAVREGIVEREYETIQLHEENKKK